MNIQKIREDFPILKKTINGKPIIYFDNACQTLRPVQVINKIKEYYTELSACGGRSIHKLGKMVDEEVNNSRKIAHKFLGAKMPEEIVFTKNTTEGINLVINSIGLNKGDIVLTTDKEHNSVLLPVQFAVKKFGVKHEIVKSNPDNTFNLEQYIEKINKNVKLVCMVHTSNIDGVTNPEKEIVKIAKENDALVLLDAAQSAPRMEINVKKLGVDFLTFSGHKICGPSGTGILYGKYELLEKMEPFIVGGDTIFNSTYTTHHFEKAPVKFEAGLQNYAGIMGLGEALKYVKSIGMDNIQKHDNKLNEFITDALLTENNISVIGPSSPKLRGSIFSFNIKHMDVHEIAMMLDGAYNIAVRSGMHCVHSWFNSRGIKGSVRASLYFYNTLEEAKIFVEAVKEIAKLGG